MKKFIIRSIFVISILFNILLGYTIYYETGYFESGGVIWTDFSLESSGTAIFLEDNQQPNTMKMVQYYKLNCRDEKCFLIESVMSGGKFIYSYLHEPEVLNLSYQKRTASLNHKNCTIQVANESTTFTCDGKTSVLGSHISLHHKQHSLFN